MQLTVLGCLAGMPADGQPSSGYLVNTGTTRILLDCGPGIATALSALTAADSIDAVVISHLHLDHCYDLLPLGKSLLTPIAHARYRSMAATTGPANTGPANTGPTQEQEQGELPLIPLYVPAGATPTLLTWASLLPVNTMPLLDQVFDGAFEIREYQPGDACAVGDATLVFRELPHAKPNCGVRITAPGGSLAYTGDTGASDEIGRLASGVDLLLAEATLDQTDPGTHGHLCATEAAQAAADARVGELVLTHFPSGDQTLVKGRVAEAARLFSGRVSAAFPGACFTVGD
jgi:ribonuclease BN (tRNA processing enzyme)